LLRAAILTNEKFRGVRLVLGAGSLKIISSNAEQEEAQEEIEIDYSGDALDVASMSPTCSTFSTTSTTKPSSCIWPMPTPAHYSCCPATRLSSTS